MEQFFPFRADPFSERRQNNVSRAVILKRTSISFTLTTEQQLVLQCKPCCKYLSPSFVTHGNVTTLSCALVDFDNK